MDKFNRQKVKTLKTVRNSIWPFSPTSKHHIAWEITLVRTFHAQQLHRWTALHRMDYSRILCLWMRMMHLWNCAFYKRITQLNQRISCLTMQWNWKIPLWAWSAQHRNDGPAKIYPSGAKSAKTAPNRRSTSECHVPWLSSEHRQVFGWRGQGARDQPQRATEILSLICDPVGGKSF